MSAQPIAPPREDLDILQALDFEIDIACEWRRAGQPCGNPAEFYVTALKTCPCANPLVPTCPECWANAATYTGCWHCLHCGSHVGSTRDETWRVVCTLRGAA